MSSAGSNFFRLSMRGSSVVAHHISVGMVVKEVQLKVDFFPLETTDEVRRE